MRETIARALGDVCDFQRGLTYKKSDEVAKPGHAVLRANNVSLGGKIDLSELRFIDKRIEIPDAKIVRKGSVLICTASGSKAHLGKAGYIDSDYGHAFGGFMGQVNPKKEIDGKYLFYCMSSPAYKDFISGLSDGTNINNLKWSDLARFRLPVPNLAEQQRIVTILNEALSGIASATANAEKNLANAREVFSSHLAATFEAHGENWVFEPLGQIAKFVDYRGKTPPKTEAGIRLITAKNVKMGYVQRTPEEFVDPTIYESWMTRGIPREGDVLFTTEAPLANVAQLDTSENVVIGQRLITLQTDPDSVDAEFLKYMLLSAPLQREIRAKGTGATVIGIKAKLLKQVQTIFPADVNEQRRLAAKLRSVEEEVDVLVRHYDARLNQLADLRRSLLAQAFSGELTDAKRAVAA